KRIPLKVTPPPLGAPALDTGEPSAEWIEGDDNRQPDRVNAGQVQPVTGGLTPRQWAEQKAYLADRRPREQNSKRVAQKNMNDVVKERHTPEGRDPVGNGATDPFERGEQHQGRTECHGEIQQ